MRGDEYVAFHGRNKIKRRAVRRDTRGMVGKAIVVARDYRQAVDIGHSDAARLFASGPVPARAPAGMARRCHGGQMGCPWANGFAVRNRATDDGGGHGVDETRLRIVRVGPPRLDCQAGRDTHADLRTRRGFQCREPAHVVEMLMAAYQQLHVARAKPKLADVSQDERRRLNRSAVDQHMSLGRGDQQNGDAAGADVICIAKNMCGRGGVGPAVAALAGGGKRLALWRDYVGGLCGNRYRGRRQHECTGGLNGHSWPRSRRAPPLSSTAGRSWHRTPQSPRLPPGRRPCRAEYRQATCRRPGSQDSRLPSPSS